MGTKAGKSEGRVQRGQRRRRQKAKGPSLDQPRREQLARRMLSQQRNGHPELLKHGKRGREEQKPAALAPRVPPAGPGRPGGLSHAPSPRVWCHLPARCCLWKGPHSCPWRPHLTLLGSQSSGSCSVQAGASDLPATLCPRRESQHTPPVRCWLLSLLFPLSPPNAGSDRVTTPWLSWGWSLGEGRLPSVHSPRGPQPHAGSGSTAGVTAPSDSESPSARALLSHPEGPVQVRAVPQSPGATGITGKACSLTGRCPAHRTSSKRAGQHSLQSCRKEAPAV